LIKASQKIRATRKAKNMTTTTKRTYRYCER